MRPNGYGNSYVVRHIKFRIQVQHKVLVVNTFVGMILCFLRLSSVTLRLFVKYARM